MKPDPATSRTNADVEPRPLLEAASYVSRVFVLVMSVAAAAMTIVLLIADVPHHRRTHCASELWSSAHVIARFRCASHACAT